MSKLDVSFHIHLCGVQAQRQFKKDVGPFHGSLVDRATWFPCVSASSMQHLLAHKFCRWDTGLPLPSLTILPVSPGIVSIAYHAADAHFLTLVRLEGTSYVTTLQGSLWPNISTPPATVFLMSRCVVWRYAVEPTFDDSSVRWGWF